MNLNGPIHQQVIDKIVDDIKNKLPNAKAVSINMKVEPNGQYQSSIEVRIKKRKLFVKKVNDTLVKSLFECKKAILKQYEKTTPQFKRLDFAI